MRALKGIGFMLSLRRACRAKIEHINALKVADYTRERYTLNILVILFALVIFE